MTSTVTLLVGQVYNDEGFLIAELSLTDVCLATLFYQLSVIAIDLLLEYVAVLNKQDVSATYGINNKMRHANIITMSGPAGPQLAPARGLLQIRNFVVGLLLAIDQAPAGYIPKSSSTTVLWLSRRVAKQALRGILRRGVILVDVKS